MEQKSARELRAFAEVTSSPPTPMGRQERLERWADLLNRDPDRIISLIRELEFACRAAQNDMRADASALSIAYNDPLFRSLGLKSDRLGDGKEFFGLSDQQAHRLLCSCMHGLSMPAGNAAALVRKLAQQQKQILSRGLVLATSCAVIALFFALN